MSDLQKREGNLKNRNCRNRMIFAAVCALMLAIAAAGCGKEEEGLQIEAIENGQEDTGNAAAENAGQEDVSTRGGTFADLKERMSVIINGNWQDDGSFLADSMVMMEFV